MPRTSKPTPSTAPAAHGFYCPAQLVPEDSVGYLMRKVLSSIRTQVDARLLAQDLTFAQWLPLYKIAQCTQTATVATLVRELETDPGSMTRALDRLEAKGLVQRERSTTDRRVVQVALTDEGRAAAAKVPPVMSDVLNGHLSDFSAQEWQQLQQLLRRMLANGEAMRLHPTPPESAE